MTQPFTREEYPLSEVTSRIIETAFAVHNGLGPGYTEITYQRALALELSTTSLAFEREVWIDVFYRGRKVGTKKS